MKTIRRYGRNVTLPSTMQVLHELRTIVLPDDKPLPAVAPPPVDPAT